LEITVSLVICSPVDGKKLSQIVMLKDWGQWAKDLEYQCVKISENF
jgi:hypothetical protein